ncbi:hypothetical protein, partial [Salmonella enterica]|uniref:hypothetical protein n=1 Tax=Salmonella enterica TaxID=28901 RepID=UPI002A69D30A
ASYPAYRSSTDVGLISAAPSGNLHRRMAASPYPAYKSVSSVGLISAAPSGRIIKQLKEFCCANH